MIRINLAPVEARRRRPGLAISLPAFNLGILFAVLYVLAAAGIGYWWWGLTAEKARIAAEVDRDQKELDSLKATLGQGANVKAQLADIKKRVDVIEALTKGQSQPILLLDAFADVVPANVWITGLEQKQGSVLKLTGTAFSPQGVNELLARLKASGKFKDVDILVSRQDLAKSPSLVTFEVTCQFEG